MSMIDIARIQKALAKERTDAWLLYDFRGLNPVAREVARVPDTILTRRWFYLIPAQGDPVGLFHPLEPGSIAHLPGRKTAYRDRAALSNQLKELVAGMKYIAMEYSAMASLPTLSYVDKGTIELIESFGPKVISSARLIQEFLAVLTPDQITSHKSAADKILRIKDQAFEHAAAAVRGGEDLNEYQLQQFILDRIAGEGMITDHDPIVAVNANSGKPHYEPTAQHHHPIRKGDFLLIDLWGRDPNGPFADITWTGYLGDQVPAPIADIFTIVARARDAVVGALRESRAAGHSISGAEADQVARGVITDAGYADHILHRTGHSITTTLHGPGANLDDMETHDIRPLVAGLLFSVEPGIYLDDFGIRSEINVLMTSSGPVVTTLPLQSEVLPLLKP